MNTIWVIVSLRLRAKYSHVFLSQEHGCRSVDIATIEMYESTLSPEDMDMRRRSQSIIMEPLDYKVNYRCLPLVT